MYIPTQKDLELLLQSIQNKYVKVELLNKNFVIIDCLEGQIIEDNYTIDSESNCRRTYSITLHVSDSTFKVNQDTKIWMDKYLRIYTGTKYIRTGEIIWYNVGIYLMNEYSYTYDETTKSLSLNCMDMMSILDGTLGGSIYGSLNIKIEAEDSKTNKRNRVRDVIINTLTNLGKIKKYIVEDSENEIPYDLEFSTGTTVYEIISTIRDLYFNWETFFDIDGIFVYQKYSSSYDEPIILNYKNISPLVISENTNNTFSNVYNFVEIWGTCIDTDYFTDDCTVEGNTYSIKIDSLKLTDDNKIPNNTKIAFRANSNNKSSQTIKINSMGAFSIVKDKEKEINIDDIKADKVYVIKYYKDKCYLQGQYQIHSIAMEVMNEPDKKQKEENIKKYNCDNIYYNVNHKSPYCIEKIGLKPNILSGNEFEKIYTDELAIERAKYELWKSTRLQDSISLEMISIPWLDVNQKVEYKSFILGEINQYIIKSIRGSNTGGTMTVEMIKFYSLYNNENQKEVIK